MEKPIVHVFGMNPKLQGLMKAHSCAQKNVRGPHMRHLAEKWHRERLQWLLSTRRVCAPVWHLYFSSCRQVSLSYTPSAWRSKHIHLRRILRATFTQVRMMDGGGCGTSDVGSKAFYFCVSVMHFKKNGFNKGINNFLELICAWRQFGRGCW